MTKKRYNQIVDEKKAIIDEYFNKMVDKIDKMNYEEFIILYLNREKDDNLKMLMSSNLNKNFSLNEAETCLISNLEEFIDDKKQNDTENIDDMIDSQLDRILENAKLDRVRNYIKTDLNIRDENEKNKINELEKERNVCNILGETKGLNEKIKKYSDVNKFKEKESEIKVEMDSDYEEDMDIDEEEEEDYD